MKKKFAGNFFSKAAASGLIGMLIIALIGVLTGGLGFFFSGGKQVLRNINIHGGARLPHLLLPADKAGREIDVYSGGPGDAPGAGISDGARDTGNLGDAGDTGSAGDIGDAEVRGILDGPQNAGSSRDLEAPGGSGGSESPEVPGDLGDLLSQLEGDSDPYPYGKAVDGSLHWENDSSFFALCGQHGAILRMSAFQIALLDLSPGEKSNVIRAADLLAGTVVGPGEYFSLNQTVGPYSRERGFKEGLIFSGSNLMTAVGGGVCKIATTLYNAVVLADLEVLERHSHSMLVPYVYPGQDATVSYGALDFSFRNNTDHLLVIWADTWGDALAVAIYGSTYPPVVTWHHELLGWQKKHTVYRHNPHLQPGEEKVRINGSGSVTVKKWLTIENFDGTTETKNLGIDRYNAMPRVIEKAF